MRHLPIFMDVRDRSVLIVGGGAAATQKWRMVSTADARITIVAPRLGEELAEAHARGEIEHVVRGFVAGDVLGRALVYAATGIDAVDSRVSEAARAAGVPVNAVDRPELSTFITPAIVNRDPILIAISSGGSAPVLARTIRAKLESMLPARLGALARFADGFRGAVKATLGEARARRRFWERFFEGPVAQQVLDGDEAGARERMLDLVNRRDAADRLAANDTDRRGKAAMAGTGPAAGKVSLVGTGPGDPDLLTFRALHVMQQADVVLFDKLIGPDMLNYVRRDAERIYVGKTRSCHAKSQDEINRLMAEHARAGQRVVRLKGGDPFLFGRGGEEMEHLRRLGVPVEVVPGITAAVGCAAAAGFPLTHRDHAQAITFVTGHGKAVPGSDEKVPDLDWPVLARGNQTLAVYMGTHTAGAIAERLVAHGLDPDTPAAVVENGTRTDQRTFTGRVADLSDLVTRNAVSGPALIVVGSVVTLAPDWSVQQAEPATALAG